MFSKHSAHSTLLPIGFRTWLWRYTYLLLLISMLWHRQAIFESKGDKLSSSAEGRIRTQDLRYLFTSRLNACWQTDWAIEDQAKNLNSTARPYDQQAFSPLDLIANWLSHLALAIYIFVVVNFDALADWMPADKPTEPSRIKLKNLNSTARPYDQQAFSPPDPTAIWHTHLALAIYIFVVVNFDALAQASDFRIERRQVVFLCWMQDSNLEVLWNPISSRLNACWQTDWAIINWDNSYIPRKLGDISIKHPVDRTTIIEIYSDHFLSFTANNSTSQWINIYMYT